MRLGRARDDTAFVEFATAMTPRLFRSALMLCGDWHLAEDLVQTTLAKLYVGWPKVAAADSSEAYARGALTKEFLSHKRLKRSSETPVADPADTEPSNDDAQRLELLEALGALPRLDRAIIVLRYWEDRTVSDTAVALSISEGAVRTRSSRALAKLRAALIDEPEAAL